MEHQNRNGEYERDVKRKGLTIYCTFVEEKEQSVNDVHKRYKRKYKMTLRQIGRNKEEEEEKK